MADQDYTYPGYARAIHLGMAGFGIAAYLTAEFAEDGLDSSGFLLHAYLGLSLAAVMLVRIVRGFAGAGPLRFSGWSPFSAKQWRRTATDIRNMAKLRFPARGMHEGVAGLVQAFGIALFSWMGATGTGIFLLRGMSAGEWFELVEEAHEIGEALIPLYLALHVGSVLLHSIAGHPVWRKMWTLRGR